MININIANQYSPFPGGRYISDGEHSGEDFRTRFLVPALDAGKKIVLELDGTRGYGSSFLEEAFGGLVRLGYAKELIRESIQLVTARESLKKEILEYIEDAQLV